MCVLFSTAINNVVWTFEELGYNDDLRASTNVEVAVQKLPQSLLLKWSEHVIVTRINRPNLTTFRDWLQGQADAHDLLPRKIKEEKRNDREERQRNTSFKAHEETSSSTQPCPLGDGQHAVTDCPVFGKMKPDERAEAATNAQLCFNCLKSGHVSRKCPSSVECDVDECKKKHHKSIHGAKRVYNDFQSGEHCSVSSSNEPQRSKVLLQVLPVTLHGPAASVKTYAMLDMGSTCSLVLTDVARKAGLKGPREKMTLNGIQQQSVFTSQSIGFEISPQSNADERHLVERAWIVKELNLPKMNVDMPGEKKKWPHLADIDLPKVNGELVTVLLGSDVFDLIVPLEVRTGPKGTPRAVRTTLGWAAASHIPGSAKKSKHVLKVHVSTPEEDVHRQVQEWWKTESFGCKYDGQVSRSVEDHAAIQILESTTQKVGDRYETGLLWKDPTTKLPNNRSVAESHLRSLERRLAKNH